MPDNKVETVSDLHNKWVQLFGKGDAYITDVYKVDPEYAKESEKESWVVCCKINVEGKFEYPWIFVNVAENCDLRKRATESRDVDEIQISRNDGFFKTTICVNEKNNK